MGELGLKYDHAKLCNEINCYLHSGKTLAQLSEESGVSRATIWHVRRGDSVDVKSIQALLETVERLMTPIENSLWYGEHEVKKEKSFIPKFVIQHLERYGKTVVPISVERKYARKAIVAEVQRLAGIKTKVFVGMYGHLMIERIEGDGCESE